jgi:hypothetical protein
MQYTPSENCNEEWGLMFGGNTGKFIVTGYRRARRYHANYKETLQEIYQWLDESDVHKKNALQTQKYC